MTPADTPAPQPARALAESMGYVLADDVAALAGVKLGTLATWARHGEGPPFVMFGRRRLYPREGLRRHLASID